MLRYCGYLASSSARSVAFRNFATSTIRQENSQPDQTDVDRLFKAEPQNRRRHAFSLNRVELIGGVGEHPVARVSRNGSEYVTFSLFTNNEFRKQDGSVSDQTEMHSIHVFGQQANFVKSNIAKGSRVLVHGRLHYEGGAIRPDGTRSVRVASVTADHIFPVGLHRPVNDNN